MHQICLNHHEVTTWGCRACLRERLDEVVKKSLENLQRDLDRIFKKPKPARRVRKSA